MFIGVWRGEGLGMGSLEILDSGGFIYRYYSFGYVSCYMRYTGFLV
jgi:hypothetical protein